MAWGNKYRILFKNLDNENWYIYIQEDNWAGAVTDFTPGPNPLEMSYSCSEKHQAVVGSSASIQVVYESAVDALFIEEERALRVYIDSDNFDWYGYIVPFQYYRKLSGKPHYATFIATDQLTGLTEKKFEHADGDPVYYIDSEMSHFQIISDRAGLDLSMREGVNVYENNFTSTPAANPLSQVYWHPEQYYDEVTDERTDCHTVLTDLLKKYAARICQWDLEWWIQRPQTLWSNHTTRHHSSTGSYLSEDTEYRLWNRQTQGGEWRADPTIVKNPRAGRVELMAEPRRLDNLFKNSTLDDFTQYIDGDTRLYYWTITSTVTIYDGYVAIDVDEYPIGNLSMKTSVKLESVTSLNLVVEFKAVWHASNSNALIRFRIESSLTGKFYSNSGWGATTDYIYDIYAATGGTSMTDYGTFNLNIPNEDGYNLLANDTLEITLVSMQVDADNTDSSYLIRNIRLEAGYGGTVKSSWPYSRDNAVDSYYIVKDTLRQVDADYDDYIVDRKTINGIHAADTVYYLQKSATKYDKTADWFIIGHPTTISGMQSIQQMLTRQYIEDAYLPYDEIQGTLRGKYNYTMALTDDDITDSYGYKKTFIGQDLTYKVRDIEWSGNWIEIAPIYTDRELDWASETYSTATIDGNEITLGTDPVVGTMSATSEAYTCVLGEMIRIKVLVWQAPGSDLPNYAFDGNTGTLAEGYNYLEFRATAGSKTFQINHTVGEDSDHVVTFWFYSLTGI